MDFTPEKLLEIVSRTVNTGENKKVYITYKEQATTYHFLVRPLDIDEYIALTEHGEASQCYGINPESMVTYISKSGKIIRGVIMGAKGHPKTYRMLKCDAGFYDDENDLNNIRKLMSNKPAPARVVTYPQSEMRPLL